MTSTRRIIFLLLLTFSIGCQEADKKAPPVAKKEMLPNIVYILADDLGYGDVSIYNRESKVGTPNIDGLASEGMRFTDMHAPSSVCTPSRYGILTGNYCWRSRLPEGVVSGYGRALIEPDQATVPAMLQKHNYYTAVIGKWHLGLDWVIKPGHESALQIPTNDPEGAKMVRDMNPDFINFTKPFTD